MRRGALGLLILISTIANGSIARAQTPLDALAQLPASADLYGVGPTTPTAQSPATGGSFPRSFLIPGTDTSIRVGGVITLNVMYVFNGGNPNAFASTTNLGNNGLLNLAPYDIHTVGPPTFAKAGNPGFTRGAELTYISPQQSKVNFETRTPTAWGEARTFMELDWANGNQFVPGNNALQSTNNLVPRLRYAYAILGGLLGGQANSNFSDSDADAENINFGGNVGSGGPTRIPQLRYTMPLAPWAILGDLSVSAEAPETDGITAAAGPFGSDATSQVPMFTTCTVAGAAGATCTLAGIANPFKAPAPDLTAAWYIPQPWGHMSFSTVVRPMLQIKDGLFVDRTFTGYGMHFGGDVQPGWFGWAKDDITFQFEYGDGIGRYLGGNTEEFALVTNYPAAAPATLAAARDVRARTTVSWGGNAGYQHWWTPTLRSNISAGIQHHDINNLGGADGFVCASQVRAASGAGGCGLDKELISSELNLIWQPVPFVSVGLEWFWGHGLALSNLKGDVNALISKFQVVF
jgi:hypothetical protein